MKYPIGTPTTGNLHVTTPQPLDNKYLYENAVDLADVATNDPLSYYEGMIVQDCDTGQKYRWIESASGIIPGGYTYGAYQYEGVIYTGRTFNFVPTGNPTVIFGVIDTFPPLENYPQGTIALRPYCTGGTIQVIHEATGDNHITITFAGTAIEVAVVNGDTIPQVTTKIQIALDADAALDDYVVTEDGIDTVTITKDLNTSADAVITFADTDGTGVLVTIADLNTLTGIYEKQNNVSPGTWTQLMTFTSMVDSSFIQSVIISMFAGTGAANTISRSDHNHTGTYSVSAHTHPGVYMDIAQDGLLYRGDLTSADDISSAGPGAWGVYAIPDGTDRPTGFPSIAIIGYTPIAAQSFWMVQMYPNGAGAGLKALREVGDGDGPICYQSFTNGGWDNWERYEASDTQMLLPTVINKNVTPASLKLHEDWVNPVIDHDWTGTFKYRLLTTGQIQINVRVDGDPATANHFLDLVAPYKPANTIYIPGTYVDTGSSTVYGAILTIDSATGKVSAASDIGAGATYDGVFQFYGTYTVD
jgi:uncharacterized Zn-finger protein